MTFFFFFIFFLLLVPYCDAAQLSFSFTSSNPNIHDIEYDGNASASNKVIQPTLNQNDKTMTSSSGRARYFKSMQLWDKASRGALADFNTHFSFVIDSQNKTSCADGITFFLAPVGFPIPFQEGSGIGLVSREQVFNPVFNSSSNPFVAVEFDTYHNPEYDPPSDHVGIDINSIKSVKNVTWLSRIPSGKMNEAWISYNSSSKNLSVAFTVMFL